MIGTISSNWSSSLFSSLNTKGYIEQSDLQSTIKSLSGSWTTASASAAEELFNQWDADGDGQVTKSELSVAMDKLAEALDEQFYESRIQEGMKGMPPPLPPAETGETDEGYTLEELTAQLEEIGTSDSKRSDLISSIIENFEAADTNSDGKVDMQEAQAYAQSNQNGASETAAAESENEKILRNVMQFLQAYTSSQATETTSSLLSVSA